MNHSSNTNIGEAIIDEVDLDLLDLILNNVNDLIAITHIDGRCRYISPSVQKMLGYSPKEVIGTFTYDYFNASDAQHIRELYNKAMKGRTNPEMRVEYQIRRKDGNYAWLQFETTQIFDSRGKFTKVLIIARDITSNRQIKKVQLERQKRLKDFEKAFSVVGMILDEAGQHIEVFGQISKLLVRPQKELKGLDLYQVLPRRDADFLVSEIQQTIQFERPRQGIYELEIGSVKRFIEWKMVPMDYITNGRKTVAVVIADVSEQQRAEKKLNLALLLRQRTNFIENIIQKKKLEAKGLANALEIDLFIPLFCCIIHVREVNKKQLEDDFLFSIIELLNSDSQLFVWDCQGDIGVIYQNKKMANDWAGAMQIASWLMDKIMTYAPSLLVTIGIGSTAIGIEGIRKSYRQARSAVVVACCQDQSGKVIRHFEQIGVYQFLEHFSEEEQAKEFVQGQIGKLIEYDRKKGTNLLGTLEEILQSASLKEAAQELYLHYNTVIFRKRRIENILGVSIDDFEIRLALAIAVKLQKLNL